MPTRAVQRRCPSIAARPSCSRNRASPPRGVSGCSAGGSASCPAGRGIVAPTRHPVKREGILRRSGCDLAGWRREMPAMMVLLRRGAHRVDPRPELQIRSRRRMGRDSPSSIPRTRAPTCSSRISSRSSASIPRAGGPRGGHAAPPARVSPSPAAWSVSHTARAHRRRSSPAGWARRVTLTTSLVGAPGSGSRRCCLARVLCAQIFRRAPRRCTWRVQAEARPERERLSACPKRSKTTPESPRPCPPGRSGEADTVPRLSATMSICCLVRELTALPTGWRAPGERDRGRNARAGTPHSVRIEIFFAPQRGWKRPRSRAGARAHRE